jgi:hypothetical protein
MILPAFSLSGKLVILCACMCRVGQRARKGGFRLKMSTRPKPWFANEGSFRPNFLIQIRHVCVTRVHGLKDGFVRVIFQTITEIQNKVTQEKSEKFRFDIIHCYMNNLCVLKLLSVLTFIWICTFFLQWICTFLKTIFWGILRPGFKINYFVWIRDYFILIYFFWTNFVVI